MFMSMGEPMLNWTEVEKAIINLHEKFSNAQLLLSTTGCDNDETMKDAAFRNLDVIKKFQNKFLEKGYNVRTFDPAGQDDIGGGCGQLWYVQKWLKSH